MKKARIAPKTAGSPVHPNGQSHVLANEAFRRDGAGGDRTPAVRGAFPFVYSSPQLLALAPREWRLVRSGPYFAFFSSSAFLVSASALSFWLSARYTAARQR